MNEQLFEKMQKLGLNLYEAKAYAGLLKVGAANAYKISKESGIPRARIYDILESLAQMGLAMVEESSDGVKIYTPTPSKIFLARKKTEWECDFEDIKTDLEELEKAENKQEIYVFTVKGRESITAFCQQLLREAEHHVMIAMWAQMYELLLPDMQACQKRGCKIIGISHGIAAPLAGVEKHQSGKNHRMTGNEHWFILAADSRKLLYGYSIETNKDAFYTEDQSHIYLMEDYMLHDMITNRLCNETAIADKMAAIMQEYVEQISYQPGEGETYAEQ